MTRSSAEFEEFDDNRGNAREDTQYRDNMIKVTGLSKKKDKNGNTYLIGALNALSQVLILPNTHKHQPNHPDYYMFIRVNPKAFEYDPNKSQTITI